MYYLLAFRCGWHEPRIRKVSKWFHLALLIGLVLALLAVPLYKNMLLYCYIVRPPFNASTDNNYRDVLWYNVVPTCISLVLMTIGLRVMMAGTKSNDDTTSPSQTVRSSMPETSCPETALPLDEQEQSPGVPESLQGKCCCVIVPLEMLLNMLGFCLTWGLFSFSQIANPTLPYTFWLVSVTLAPLQGVCQALLYRCSHRNPHCRAHTSLGHSSHSVVEMDKRGLQDSSGLENIDKTMTDVSEVPLYVTDDLLWDNGDICVALEATFDEDDDDDDNRRQAKLVLMEPVLLDSDTTIPNPAVTGDLMWDGLDSDRLANAPRPLQEYEERMRKQHPTTRFSSKGY